MPFAAIGDGNAAGGTGDALDARQFDEDHRAGDRGVTRVGEQVRDGGLELRRIDEDRAAVAEPQLEDAIGAERVLERRQPRRQRLMRIEPLDARRADTGKRLELPGQPHAALEAGARHANDAAARRHGIGQTIDAAGENLQHVRELVPDDRGDAGERLDVSETLEAFSRGMHLRSGWRHASGSGRRRGFQRWLGHQRRTWRDSAIRWPVGVTDCKGTASWTERRHGAADGDPARLSFSVAYGATQPRTRRLADACRRAQIE